MRGWNYGMEDKRKGGILFQIKNSTNNKNVTITIASSFFGECSKRILRKVMTSSLGEEREQCEICRLTLNSLFV